MAHTQKGLSVSYKLINIETKATNTLRTIPPFPQHLDEIHHATHTIIR